MMVVLMICWGKVAGFWNPPLSWKRRIDFVTLLWVQCTLFSLAALLFAAEILLSSLGFSGISLSKSPNFIQDKTAEGKKKDCFWYLLCCSLQALAWQLSNGQHSRRIFLQLKRPSRKWSRELSIFYLFVTCISRL